MTVRTAYTLEGINPDNGIKGDMDDCITIEHPNGTRIETLLIGDLPKKSYYDFPILYIKDDNYSQIIVLDL